jgi:hypothetical protein
MVWCNVVSLAIVQAMAVNCSPTRSAVGGAGGPGRSSGSIDSCASVSVARSARYSRTTMADASGGMATHGSPISSSAAGSSVASTKAKVPSSPMRSSRSDRWPAIRRGVSPVPAMIWNPR